MIVVLKSYLQKIYLDFLPTRYPIKNIAPTSKIILTIPDIPSHSTTISILPLMLLSNQTEIRNFELIFST